LLNKLNYWLMQNKLKYFTLLIVLISLELAAADWGNASFYGGFKGLHVTDKFTKSRVLSLKAAAAIDYKISEDLKAIVFAGVLYEAGSNSSLFVSENNPESELVLKEGYLAYSPLEMLTLSIGALDQEKWKSPLFLTETPFLGAEEKLSLKWGEYQIYIKALQSIPQNQNLSDRAGNVNEGTPTFFAESLGIRLGGDILSFKVEGTQYSFSELGHGVAHQSGLLGNSTSGNQDNARFLYRFQGYNLSTELEIHGGDIWGLLFSGHYTFNDKAPNNRNAAYLAHGGMLFGVLELFVESFENQSDASIAYYNSKTYGHNNRQGQSLGLKWGGDSEKMKVSLRYTVADLILKNQNNSQANSKIVLFNLTKKFNF
jgi:hypothetical protein